MSETSEDYQAGLRDGKLQSLEVAVTILTTDVAKLKLYTYTLYGAIGLIQLLPAIKSAFTQ